MYSIERLRVPSCSLSVYSRADLRLRKQSFESFEEGELAPEYLVPRFRDAEPGGPIHLGE